MYDYIKNLADEKGLTIMALEKAAGLSNGTIGKWRDSSKGVTLESVKRIAEVLGVTIDDIAKRTEK